MGSVLPGIAWVLSVSLIMPRLFGPTPSAAAAQVLPWNQYLDTSYNTSVGLDRQRQQMELEDAYRRSMTDDQSSLSWAKMLDELQSGDERRALAEQELGLRRRALDVQSQYPEMMDKYAGLASDRQLANQLAILKAQEEANKRLQEKSSQEKKQMAEATTAEGAKGLASAMQQSYDLGRSIRNISLLKSLGSTPWYLLGGHLGGTTSGEYAKTIKGRLSEELGLGDDDPLIASIKDQPSGISALNIALSDLAERKKSLDAEITAMNKAGMGLYVQPFLETPEPTEEDEFMGLPADRPVTRFRSTFRGTVPNNPFIPPAPVITQPEAASMPKFRSQREGQEAARAGRWRAGTRYVAPGIHGPDTVYEIR